MDIYLVEKMYIKTFFLNCDTASVTCVYTNLSHVFICFCRLWDPSRLNRSQRLVVWLADV